MSYTEELNQKQQIGSTEPVKSVIYTRVLSDNEGQQESCVNPISLIIPLSKGGLTEVVNNRIKTKINNITEGTDRLTESTIDGTAAQQLQLTEEPLVDHWTSDQYYQLSMRLREHGLQYLKGREEYILFKEIVVSNSDRNTKLLSDDDTDKPSKIKGMQSGVNSPFGNAIVSNDTTLKEAPSGSDAFTTQMTPSVSQKAYAKPFLAPLDVQKSNSIAESIPSFRAIQSDAMSLNIGFDTEFQDFRDGSGKNRRMLSLQMTLDLGTSLIRYFFLIDPRYQEVTENGGLIPLKYCLADILNDLKDSYFPDFPLERRDNLVYKDKSWKEGQSYKMVDYKAMKDKVIPITLVCHTGKADIPAFRRAKYDIDIFRKLGEIQGGWMTTKNVYFKAENDANYNYWWLISLSVRDTLGLTPADNKSLASLGDVIHRPKIELPNGVKDHMADYAIRDPISFYEYAMNDSDIVVSFCSELFGCNHAIPITLSSATASSMCDSIKRYFGVKSKAEYDRIYRGLEMLDEGLVPSADECLKFLKSTRYVPIRDNPDAKLISEYFEEAYTGGFNASFEIGWITNKTTDFDLQNAYPTGMSCIIDIDWSKNVRDFDRNSELSLQALPSPLIPAVAVGDFDFPDDCYCPNIPVPVKGGMKIYPLHGRNVYMTGVDMYLALKLGARINIFRGFTCHVLKREGKPSKCLSAAVTNLVQDRIRAKIKYKDNPLIEKTLKTMVNTGYGKTAQGVSPKTLYNAKTMGRVDAEPSAVTSPYHAAYTTALVRCMLIACINQLHNMGYMVYSVTTDGFITNASAEIVRGLDAYGFSTIFQSGRYTLNQTKDDCDANQVWEPKHYNDVFLNITTRGNVAVNDEGVLAHNSYTTGELKDSRADRDAYIIAVLAREGRLQCKTSVWTQFSDIVERKHDFHVSETIRQLSMNFDYKRCPIVETAVDTPVHYESADGRVIDAVIAEFDTRPFYDAEEFLNYRGTMRHEDCVKVTADLERVRIKSTFKTSGYIGKDLNRKILLSILMGYRSGLYEIPALDGLKQSEAVATINGWGISFISLSDWKNCSRSNRQENMLPHELVEPMLQLILSKGNGYEYV